MVDAEVVEVVVVFVLELLGLPHPATASRHPNMPTYRMQPIAVHAKCILNAFG